MKTMNMPGFAAEASFAATRGLYGAAGTGCGPGWDWSGGPTILLVLLHLRGAEHEPYDAVL